jgi:hypothetical protein
MKRLFSLFIIWSLIFVIGPALAIDAMRGAAVSAASLFANANFGDLPTKHPYNRSIQYLQNKNIIKGYSDNTVRADRLINRAEFLKLLLEGFNTPLQAGSQCFSDIDGSAWFATYVCTAKTKGIVNGLPDGSFQPGRNINKAEAIKIIVNTIGIPQKIVESKFSDVTHDDWFHPFVTTGEEGNFLEEKESHFNPGENYSRGQVSEILYRVLSAQDQNQTVYTGSDSSNDLSESDKNILKWQLFAFDHINQLRADNGIDPIKINPLLNEIAKAHSQDMALNIKTMSHDGSLGEQAHERIKEGKVPQIGSTVHTTLPFPKNIGWSGENVGMRNIQNFENNAEKALISQHEWFMDEAIDVANHRTTMLSTLFPFTEVGIGLSLDEQGNLWITEDYISIQN